MRSSPAQRALERRPASASSSTWPTAKACPGSETEPGSSAALWSNWPRSAGRCANLHTDFEITIVQPGVRKSDLNDGQRDLLASTQLYLSETYAVPLSVIFSA
jgi:hypothetical protein